jgi:hypothetical protein
MSTEKKNSKSKNTTKRSPKVKKENISKQQPVAQESVALESPETVNSSAYYRLIGPYWNTMTIILVDHIFNQHQWKKEVIDMIMNNKIPMDIVDTTMLMDENYDEKKYSTWVARMMQKSDFVLFNIHHDDDASTVPTLEKNLETEMIKSKYVLVRIDPDTNVDILTNAMTVINKYENVIPIISDKNLIQSLAALTKE